MFISNNSLKRSQMLAKDLDTIVIKRELKPNQIILGPHRVFPGKLSVIQSKLGKQRIWRCDS